MKLNDLLKENCVTVFGFPAFKELEMHSSKEGDAKIFISILSAGVMFEKGIQDYYSLVLPRNARFSSAEEILAADLDVNLIHVDSGAAISASDEVIIASRHEATIELLKGLYPNNIVMESVTAESITGKNVVGSLPPHLIQYAKSFIAIAIRDFDYNKDGDLGVDELMERLIISPPIKVSVVK